MPTGARQRRRERAPGRIVQVVFELDLVRLTGQRAEQEGQHGADWFDSSQFRRGQDSHNKRNRGA